MIVEIAHYRKLKIWLQLLFSMVILLMAPLLTYLAMHHHFADPMMGSRRWPIVIALLAAIWLLAGFGCFLIQAAFRQILFENYLAVWISDGYLIFLRRSIFCVLCADISKISRGRAGHPKLDAIILHLRNGTQTSFPTGSLFERPDAIVSRLAEILTVPIESQYQ
jgi:hypothetical protein